MRVLVTGARDYNDYRAVATCLTGYLILARDRGEKLVVIEGGATGADQLARSWASLEDDYSPYVELITVEAEWDRLGKRAGPARNTKMLKEHKPSVVLAFHDDLEWSLGTKDCVKKAKKYGIPVYLVSRP